MFLIVVAKHTALPQERVCVVNPEEVHTGKPGNHSFWTYWNFFPDVNVLRRIAEDIYLKPCPVPEFRANVISDPMALQKLSTMFAAIGSASNSMEKEFFFYEAVSYLIAHHTDLRNPVALPAAPFVPVKRTIEKLLSEPERNISLEELAQCSGMSKYHLLRSFKAHTGLPPHAFLLQHRIAQAKSLIMKGFPISHAAAELGFTDQAHLSRHFKRTFGFSPGYLNNYSNNVQEE